MALNCWLLEKECIYCAVRVQSRDLGGSRVRSRACPCKTMVDKVTLRSPPPWISVSPVSIMPPILHIHFHLHTALARANGWSLGTFRKQRCLGNKGAVYTKKSITPSRTDWPSVVMWRSLDENCALLGCYTTGSDNSLPTFRNNLSVLSSSVKNPISLIEFSTLEMGPIGCFEKSVRNYHYSLRNSPEESRSDLLRGGSLISIWCDLLFEELVRH
jgi:hypothetical protein